MALTDKDIVITPNRGQSADPKIVFSGADGSTSAQNITLQVYPINSGTLSFEGSAGQLFSITNTLTGTIFSVNDVSGIPSIEVLDTGAIKLAQYGGNVGIGAAPSGSYKLEVTGTGYFSSDLTVAGNLTVNGTTTTINSTTISVDDKNIELGSVASPSNTTADGGGITLKGATDKTFNWVNSTSAWTSSEHLDLASGKAYYINGTSVLSSTTLGSGVTASSLTSVGTLTSLTVSGNSTFDTNTLFVDATNHRVGIGTNAPAYKLEVYGGTGIVANFIRDAGGQGANITTNAGGNYLNFTSTSGGGAPKPAFIIADTYSTSMTIGTTSANPLIFNTNNTERMRINSAGNVGIANNSPSEKLDVTGNTKVSGRSTAKYMTVSGAIAEFGTTIDENYTITTGQNAMSVGPVTVPTGIVVTVPTGSRWIII